FNTGSFGISVMGDHSSIAPPRAAMVALAHLVGWKLLSTFQTNVKGTSSWPTAEGTKHSQGDSVSLPKMFGHRDVNYTECPGDGLYARFGSLRSEAQGFNDGGWKEHLWAFQGAGGASALGTVIRSAHRTGRFTATQLTEGLVLQESGDAHGYATPFGPHWSADWGRPTRSASDDGDRRIQPFESGTAALEGDSVRFVTPVFRDVAPERVFFLEIQDLFAAAVTERWGSGGDRTCQPAGDNLRDAVTVLLLRAAGAPSSTTPWEDPRTPRRRARPSATWTRDSSSTRRSAGPTTKASPRAGAAAATAPSARSSPSSAMPSRRSCTVRPVSRRRARRMRTPSWTCPATTSSPLGSAGWGRRGSAAAGRTAPSARTPTSSAT